MGVVFVFVFVAACGRIAFDPIPRCDVAAPFTNVRPLTDLNTTSLDGALRLSSDELTAYFQSERTGYAREHRGAVWGRHAVRHSRLLADGVARSADARLRRR